MNKVLSAIGHFVKNAAVKVAHGFEAIFGSDQAHAFAVGAESLLKTALGQIVWAAVNAAQSLATDGAGKRDAAFSNIASVAKAQGIAVADHIVNMLIEIAVSKIKGEFGPA